MHDHWPILTPRRLYNFSLANSAHLRHVVKLAQTAPARFFSGGQIARRARDQQSRSPAPDYPRTRSRDTPASVSGSAVQSIAGLQSFFVQPKRGYSQKVSAGISWRLEFLSGKSLPDDQPGSNRRATRVVWWVQKFNVKTKGTRLKRKYLVRRFLKKRFRPFF